MNIIDYDDDEILQADSVCQDSKENLYKLSSRLQDTKKAKTNKNKIKGSKVSVDFINQQQKLLNNKHLNHSNSKTRITMDENITKLKARVSSLVSEKRQLQEELSIERDYRLQAIEKVQEQELQIKEHELNIQKLLNEIQEWENQHKEINKKFQKSQIELQIMPELREQLSFMKDTLESVQNQIEEEKQKNLSLSQFHNMLPSEYNSRVQTFNSNYQKSRQDSQHIKIIDEKLQGQKDQQHFLQQIIDKNQEVIVEQLDKIRSQEDTIRSLRQDIQSQVCQDKELEKYKISTINQLLNIKHQIDVIINRKSQPPKSDIQNQQNSLEEIIQFVTKHVQYLSKFSSLGNQKIKGRAEQRFMQLKKVAHSVIFINRIKKMMKIKDQNGLIFTRVMDNYVNNKDFWETAIINRQDYGIISNIMALLKQTKQNTLTLSSYHNQSDQSYLVKQSPIMRVFESLKSYFFDIQNQNNRLELKVKSQQDQLDIYTSKVKKTEEENLKQYESMEKMKKQVDLINSKQVEIMEQENTKLQKCINELQDQNEEREKMYNQKISYLRRDIEMKDHQIDSMKKLMEIKHQSDLQKQQQYHLQMEQANRDLKSQQSFDNNISQQSFRDQNTNRVQDRLMQLQSSRNDLRLNQDQSDLIKIDEKYFAQSQTNRSAATSSTALGGQQNIYYSFSDNA
eukprot:403363064